VSDITLTLSIEETNSILAVLGDLPTKLGAFPLLLKIKQQADAQAPAPVAPAEVAEAA
jgi:hypothetical protein